MTRRLTSSHLQQLEKAWLLGTQRGPPPAPPGFPSDPHALAALAWRAHQLQLTVAAPRSTDLPSPIEAPDDPRPPFPDPLRPALRRLVIAADARSQTSLLTAVAWWIRDAGVRLHPFDTWAMDVAELAPCMGPYEAWVAAQTGQPSDDPATAPTDETWETYGPAHRVRWLAGRREQDPEAALDLLRACWGSERADVRRRLLEALATNLGSYDRAFLEGLANDRSKKVQEHASILLARIPGSEQHAATREVLAETISVKRGLRGPELLIAAGADMRQVLLTVAHFHPYDLADALGFDRALILGNGDAPALCPAFAVGALRHDDDALVDAILGQPATRTVPLSLWLDLLDGVSPEQARSIAPGLVAGRGAATLLADADTAAEWAALMQGPLTVPGALALRGTLEYQAVLDALTTESGPTVAEAIRGAAVLIPPAGARDALTELEARGGMAAPLIQALWRLLADLHEVSVDPASPGR